MRKVKVTGGYVGEVTVEVRDRNGADLSLAGFKMMLLAVGSELPLKTSNDWKTPSAAVYEDDGGESVARLTLTVSSSTPLGAYMAWALPSVGPTSVPICATNEIVKVE